MSGGVGSVMGSVDHGISASEDVGGFMAVVFEAEVSGSDGDGNDEVSVVSVGNDVSGTGSV